MSKEPIEARALTGTELAHPPKPRSRPITKIERYGWTTPDEPGEFKLINKNELVIDPEYQRTLSNTKVSNLAREWSWIACGAISVSWREPLARHLYYVMEGQHRVAAAQRRADIQTMPCMVFKSLSLKEEAAGFVNANSNRRSLTMEQRHKGSLIAGTHGAIVVDELVRSIGRIVAPYTAETTISCVGAMLHAIETDEPALRRIFTLIGLLCDGNPIPRNLLVGMFYLETHLPEGQSLASTRLTNRLLNRGYTQVMESITAAMRLHGKGRPSTYAAGILVALNYRSRNPVRLVDANAEEAP